MVTLCVLVAGVIMLFFVAQPQAPEMLTLQTSHSTSSVMSGDAQRVQTNVFDSSAALAAEASVMPVRASLDTDTDNDDKDDGIADPLAVFVSVLLLIPLVGSLFLLSVFELPKLSCAYCLPLERPG